jgi:hypothetical protein
MIHQAKLTFTRQKAKLTPSQADVYAAKSQEQLQHLVAKA